MDKKLLDLLACPECKGPLLYRAEQDQVALICKSDRLAYPVRDGVPVMLTEEARELSDDEEVD